MNLYFQKNPQIQIGTRILCCCRGSQVCVCVCVCVCGDIDTDTKGGCSGFVGKKRAERWKNMQNKGCVLQLQPTQISDTVSPLHRAARIAAFVCPRSDRGELFCLHTATHAHTHTPTVTCQYQLGFLLAVVPARAWLLGSVCLVLIWLHELHRRRGFTLNRIFGAFYWLDLTRRIPSDEPRLRRQEGLRLSRGCATGCVRALFLNERTLTPSQRVRARKRWVLKARNPSAISRTIWIVGMCCSWNIFAHLAEHLDVCVCVCVCVCPSVCDSDFSKVC